MVRQWQEMFYKGRYKEVDLRRGMPDFVKLAEAYGIKGLRVRRLGELEDAMAETRAHDGPVLPGGRGGGGGERLPHRAARRGQHRGPAGRPRKS